MSKRGLPISLKMRHDAHYVDALASSAGTPIGRLVPDRPGRPESGSAAAGHGRPVRAHGVDRREGHHRAARSSGSAAAGIRSSPASAATRRPSRLGSGSCRSSFATSTTPRSSRSRSSRTSSARTSDRSKRPKRWRASPRRCGYTHEDLAKRLGKSRTSDHGVAGAGRDARTRSEISVGWPTFPLSHCFYR